APPGWKRPVEIPNRPLTRGCLGLAPVFSQTLTHATLRGALSEVCDGPTTSAATRGSSRRSARTACTTAWYPFLESSIGGDRGMTMKAIGLLAMLAALAMTLSLAAPAAAQQVTGTPGSPSATTTIQGDQIPAPPAKFGGTIGETPQK